VSEQAQRVLGRVSLVMCGWGRDDKTGGGGLEGSHYIYIYIITIYLKYECNSTRGGRVVSLSPPQSLESQCLSLVLAR